MEIQVYSFDGGKTSEKVKLNPDVFGIEPNDHVIYLAVKAYLANRRQGTNSVKTRSEVAGGGRKPFKQKGTGRARQGTIRAAHMVGGGRAFGPVPRSYEQNIPRKVKKLARNSALSQKAKEGKLFVVEDFNFEKPKTKKVVELLKNLNLDGNKVLILTRNYDPVLLKSARNIPYTRVQRVPEFSTHDIVSAQVLIFQKEALETANEVLA